MSGKKIIQGLQEAIAYVKGADNLKERLLAAVHDDRLSTGALYREALARIEELERAALSTEPEQEQKPPYAPEGHNEPCAFCGKPCNGWAGDPGKWPLGFCHYDGTGKIKWHHTRCVTDRLFQVEPTEPEQEQGDLAGMGQ